MSSDGTADLLARLAIDLAASVAEGEFGERFFLSGVRGGRVRGGAADEEVFEEGGAGRGRTSVKVRG
jgi:hypothetical protein